MTTKTLPPNLVDYLREVQSAVDSGAKPPTIKWSSMRLLRDDGYLDFRTVDVAESTEPVGYIDVRVLPRGLREIEEWPQLAISPTDLLGALEAAETAQTDPQEQDKIHRARLALQGVSRDVLVGVVTEMTKRIVGLP